MRIFISIDVPSWIKRAVYSVQRELLEYNINVVNSANMHFTIKFLGEVNSKKIQKIEQQLRTVRHSAFEVIIKGVSAFPNEHYVRVIWAGCKTKELVELVNKINKVLPEFPTEQFVGHLTLARVKKKINLKSFFEKYREWRFGDFKVEKFYLMASELTPSEAKYSTLAEYILVN